MKKLLSLLLAVLLLSGCAAGHDGPTAEKSVPAEFIREHHQPTTGHVDTERIVYAYDIYGNMVRSVEYRNGRESSRTDFTYDERGNLLTRTYYSLGGWFPKRTGSAEFIYDEQDRIIAEIYDHSRYDYIFDDEARTCTKLEGSTVMSVTTYDEFGNVLCEKTFNCGTEWHLVECIRDDKGELLMSRTTDSTGLDITNRSERDDHGNTIFHETVENGVRTERHYSYEYDDQGRLLREFELRDGVPVEVYRWEYLDENGSYTLWHDGFRSYTRRFDAEGNMTENSHFVNKTDQYGIREFTIYKTIRVPAEEVFP